MMGTIDHMDHALTIGSKYLNTFHYSRIAIDRNLTGERRSDEQVDDVMPTDNKFQYEERTLTKTVVEDSQWVVEKYDQNGKLVRMTPPGYIPFDRMMHSILV